MLITFISSVILMMLKCMLCDRQYNIPDPECSGPFGMCTQRDKDILGYKAIKKLHENMDENHDGQIDIKETKEFIEEELQFKKGNERQHNFHHSDSFITFDELWKLWKLSPVHNWTTEQVIYWIKVQVKLPQYEDNLRRNQVDGQFLPRFAANENNYLSNIMQIKDLRHRNKLIIKASDLILFGESFDKSSLIKDVCMIAALTISVLVCTFALLKQRKSQEKINEMMRELSRLENSKENWLKPESSSIDLASKQVDASDHQRLIDQYNELKDEAERLRKARENENSELQKLKLAEQELNNVRMALRKSEEQSAINKYEAPYELLQILKVIYVIEKEYLELKVKLIEEEKKSCMEELNKVSKRQVGFIINAFKIAHTATIEEINNRLDLIKGKIEQHKKDRLEWQKRWHKIKKLTSLDFES